MIRLIGSGEHAKVVREVIAAIYGEVNLVMDFEFVAVGNNRDRKREAEKLQRPIWPLVHPTAHISPSARIKEGTVVMAGVVVQADAHIGRHVILNTGCTVDHDCIIEDYAHIAPGAHLCGGVRVGEGALVGVGVGIALGATIPAWHLVKARKLEIEPLPSN